MSSSTNPPAEGTPITIVHDGRPFTGRYTLENGIVTVRLGRDLRTAALGRSSAENVARMLMYELTREE